MNSKLSTMVIAAVIGCSGVSHASVDSEKIEASVSQAFEKAFALSRQEARAKRGIASSEGEHRAALESGLASVQIDQEKLFLSSFDAKNYLAMGRNLVGAERSKLNEQESKRLDAMLAIYFTDMFDMVASMPDQKIHDALSGASGVMARLIFSKEKIREIRTSPITAETSRSYELGRGKLEDGSEYQDIAVPTKIVVKHGGSEEVTVIVREKADGSRVIRNVKLGTETVDFQMLASICIDLRGTKHSARDWMAQYQQLAGITEAQISASEVALAQ